MEQKQMEKPTETKPTFPPVLSCTSCQTTNRLIAKFCKNCGKPLESRDESCSSHTTPVIDINEIVGLASIKKEISALINRIKIHNERRAKGLPDQPLYLHSVFKGSTGTGKTIIAQYLSKTFKELGALSKGTLVQVDQETFSKTCPKSQGDAIKEWIQKAKGGILLIDEIHKDTQRISSITKGLQTAGDDIIVILAGIKKPIDEYFEKNPDDMQRVGKIFDFPDYGADDLCEIAKMKLRKLGYDLTDGAGAKLRDYIKGVIYSGESTFKNGWLVDREILPKIQSQQSNRLASLEDRTDDDLTKILEEDIPGDGIVQKTPDEVLASLDKLVGLAEVKKEIRKLAQSILIQKEQVKAGIKGSAAVVHIVFTGNPGTGKTTIARRLGELFRAMGLLPGGQVIDTDRSKLVAQYVGQTAPNVNKFCDMAMGGILFIDEAYTLAGEEGMRDSFGQEAIDALLKRMEDDRGKFIAIAAGYKEEMERFIASNSGLKSRFTHFFHLEDYCPEELFGIFEIMARSAGFQLRADASEKARNVFKDVYRKRDKKFANGRTVRNLFESTVKELGSRLSSVDPAERTPDALKTITADDIPYELDKVESVEDILKELDTLVGMENIKKEVRDLLDFVNMQRKREKAEGKRATIALHFVLTGNPGTGKTTVARVIGKLFKNIGILPSAHIVETDKAGLVGQYVGSTPKKVHEVVDRAMGGVLFIDEAYTLTPEGHSDPFSQEAIDTLMKRMEDDRGKFIVMAAGYQKEMERFLNSNPGLNSRFNRKFNFEDYKPDELKAILLMNAKSRGFAFTDEAMGALSLICKQMYDQRGAQFGNGRDIRNLFERAIQKQSARLCAVYKDKEPDDPAVYSTIEAADLFEEKRDAVATLETSLAQLETLIGLRSVKEQVKDLISYLKVEQMRSKSGGKSTELTLHFVFTGNPGTGKTTVGRIIADIFRAMGLLTKGQLVEVDRSGLVGQYVGETAQKTKAVIDRAMGGILFVDEAYALAPEGGGNDFGKEAIDTLLKRMEDDRGKFIVIAAGYKNEMQRFLDSNPGLMSRFTRFIDFEDYLPEELQSIYMSMVAKKGLRMSDPFVQKLKQRCIGLRSSRDKNFANGRTVRNMFEATMQNQARRVASAGDAAANFDLFNTLQPEDLA